MICTAHQIIYTAHQIICTAHQIICTAHQIIYTAHQIIYTAHQIICTAHQIICTAHQILFGRSNREEWDGQQHVCGKREVYTEFWCRNLWERDHLEEPGIDGRKDL